MIDSILTFFFGSKKDRDIKQLLPIVEKVNAEESWAASLSETEVKEATNNFKQEIQNGKSLDDILPKAFALAREAAKRVLGERPYDTQIMGSLVLHSGRLAELKTGEGKTLMTVAAAYLNALTGKGVHVVTVNDYLAKRDSEWNGNIFRFLGLTVGLIVI